MRHPSIPQSLTPEALAQWIQDNADRHFEHVEETDLTPEVISELEHKLSLAQRAIDRLEEVKENFMDLLKNGTPDEGEPFDVTIPPTKGLKILTENRKWASKQLEQGFSEEKVQIFMVPDPEDGKMIAMDIEGTEWERFSADMTEDEHKKYGKLFTKDKKPKKKGVEEATLDL